MSILTPDLSQTFSPATHIAGVRFTKLGKLFHFDYTDYPDLRVGDYIIVETVRSLQMGQIVGFVGREDEQRGYKSILRMATPRDMLLHQQWKAKEVEALIDCREAASKMNKYAGVKFIKAEYSFDGSYLTIMYSSDDEIETAPLYSALRKKISGNIDFRQIGPRDVARIMGGQGACGGPRCCSTFLTEFSPISIKMAKAQGIPLNPTEITGMCGRLRCCLVYEYEQYIEARKKLPKRGKLVGTPQGEGRVLEVYPLRDGVTVLVEEQRYFVEREQIIPMEEFRALQNKALGGCTRNETGGCDCGARRPKSGPTDFKAALDLAHTATPLISPRPELEETSTEETSQSHEESRKRRRHRRRDREEPKAEVEAASTPSEGETPAPDAEQGEARKQQKHRFRRRRRHGSRRSDSSQGEATPNE